MSSPPKRTAAISFIFITILIDVLGIGIVIPILPALIKQFVGGGESEAAWYVGVIGTSYALMQFLFAPILGALSDRFGRRPVLLVSLFGLGIDYIIQGLSPNIAWLFAGRLIAGIMGASFTTANAYIADISNDETRARNFGMVGVAFGLGFIIGPALGGLLGSHNLRWPFYVSAALALTNWLYGFFILPESLSIEHRSPFSLARANPLTSILRLREYPIVAALAVPWMLISLAQRGLENVWVLFTKFRFGWDELTNGLVLGLVGVMAVIVQGGLVRPVIKRFGERRTAIGGLCISATAFLCYSLGIHPWMILVTIIFGSLGGLSGPALQSIIAKAVDPNEQGQIQGALQSLVSLTNIVAPTFFTSFLFSYFTSDRAPIKFAGIPFFVGSMLILIATLLVFRTFKRIAA
jgi:DHA1 family tetracycline resistance protein-like MFS transporter